MRGLLATLMGTPALGLRIAPPSAEAQTRGRVYRTGYLQQGMRRASDADRRILEALAPARGVL